MSARPPAVHGERGCSFCEQPLAHCREAGPGCAVVWEEAVRTGSIPVVAAVLEVEDRLLLCQRPSGKRHGGLWEFPGGKLLPGESLADGLARELSEELALRLSRLGGLVARHADPGSRYVVHFVAAAADGVPVALEHERVGWFTPAEALELPLAPSDRAFLAAWRSSPPSGEVGKKSAARFPERRATTSTD